MLDTFPIVRREDEAAFGRYRTRDLILTYMKRPRRRGYGDASGGLGECTAKVGKAIEVAQEMAKKLFLWRPAKRPMCKRDTVPCGSA